MTHRQAEFRTPASRARYGKAAKGFVQQRQGGGISSPHAFRLYDTVSKGAVRVSAAKYCTPAGGAPVKAPRAPKAPKVGHALTTARFAVVHHSGGFGY